MVWELTLTLTLMASAMALALPMLQVWRLQQRAQARQMLALHELSNQLEDWGHRPYAELTPAAVATANLSDVAARQLPQPQLTLTVTEFTAAPAGKRLQAALTWQRASGTAVPPLTLTTWVFAPSTTTGGTP